MTVWLNSWGRFYRMQKKTDNNWLKGSICIWWIKGIAYKIRVLRVIIKPTHIKVLIGINPMGAFNVVLFLMFGNFACRQLGKYYSYKNNNASKHFLESHGLMEYEPSEENRKYRFHAHDERSNGGIRCSLSQNLERISNTAGKDTGV